ncbi:MAG: hypothetical protein HY365_03175 [Candidatus Aenigmarchaeota archaeon]|nr:hypothetical protein [Candidatus Aenigmarchaeota archaeon]
MVNPFELLVSNLSSLGFFNFFLPFLFVFAVLYGLLLKSHALGDDPKVTGVVSLAMAFLTIGFGGPLLGAFFINLAGAAAILLSGILIIILVVGLAGGKLSDVTAGKGITAIMAGIGVVIVYSIFQSLTNTSLDNSLAITILIIVLMLGAVMFITGAGNGH